MYSMLNKRATKYFFLLDDKKMGIECELQSWRGEIVSRKKSTPLILEDISSME